MTDEAGYAAATGEEEPAHETPVPGTVRLMTEEPVELPRDGAGGLGQEVSRIVNRRPWLVPAVLLGAAMAYLLVRRRR